MTDHDAQLHDPAHRKEAWRLAWTARYSQEEGLPHQAASDHEAQQAPWQQLKTLGQWGWLRQEPPPRRTLLGCQGECVLPLGKVGFFIGEGGVGKSWAVCQMAIAVASGVPWFQTFEVPPESKGAVLLAMAEEDQDELHRRLFQATGAMRLEAAQLADVEANIWPMALAGTFVEFLKDGEPGWMHRAFDELLRQGCPAEGWRLIVLDPASRFMGVDAEKDNAYATRFVQLLEQLTKLPGHPTVLCVHHTSKSSRQAGQSVRAVAARGASALTDGARWQGNLSPLYDQGTGEQIEGAALFQVTKSNYGPMPGPVYLQRQPGSGVLLRVHDPHRPAGGVDGVSWSSLSKEHQDTWHNFASDIGEGF